MEQATLERHAVRTPTTRRRTGIIPRPPHYAPAPAIRQPGTDPRGAEEPLTDEVHALATATDTAPNLAPELHDLALGDDDLRLLAEIATGVTTEVAARRLDLSARTLRRRIRTICDRLEVNTPIEAVVWAARRNLI